MQLLEDELISVYPVDARGLMVAEVDATTHTSTRQVLMNPGLQRDNSNRLLDTLIDDARVCRHDRRAGLRQYQRYTRRDS